MPKKHMPSPWRADGPDGLQDFNILHSGDSLAVAAVISNMREPPEIEANARLIAASSQPAGGVSARGEPMGSFGRRTLPRNHGSSARKR
jgi:hypothetical protein